MDTPLAPTTTNPVNLFVFEFTSYSDPIFFGILLEINLTTPFYMSIPETGLPAKTARMKMGTQMILVILLYNAHKIITFSACTKNLFDNHLPNITLMLNYSIN